MTMGFLVCLGTDLFVEIQWGVQALKRILRKLLTLKLILHNKSGNKETQGYQSNSSGTSQIGNSYWRYNDHKISLSLRFFPKRKLILTFQLLFISTGNGSVYFLPRFLCFSFIVSSVVTQFQICHNTGLCRLCFLFSLYRSKRRCA